MISADQNRTMLTTPLDANMIKQTVDYFRTLGFSEQDVKAIEQDLLEQQQNVLKRLEHQSV